MGAFQALLDLSDEEKAEQGIEHTPREIAQQPETWKAAAANLRARRDEIVGFMESTGLRGKGDATLMLTGAGTSEFVGNSVVNVLRSGLKRDVHSIATTHFVTHPGAYFVPGRDYVLLSFARSGNSPESVATYRKVLDVCPEVGQLVVTCNPDGELAKVAAVDGNAYCLLMPPETNDKSLVMTSSFSTMAFSALGLTMLDDLDRLDALADAVGQAARRVMGEYGDTIKTFADRSFTRACFLGSNALFGTMQECHLKMQEMTEGQIACAFDSFLGLRHGPQVVAGDDCIIIAALSTDPYVQKYELDLLREMKAKRQGAGTLVICDQLTDEIRRVCDDAIELFPDGGAVSDDHRVMTDVVVGQVLGTFTSLKVGLKPDNPSVSGTINRVVQGVVIY